MQDNACYPANGVLKQGSIYGQNNVECGLMANIIDLKGILKWQENLVG